MSARAGFTLLEVMVSLVVTGMVVLLAYATARAGFDTRDRVARYADEVEARAIARALLFDALRHLPEGGGAAMNDELFVVHDEVDSGGVPADRLQFLSRGITPPLGSSEPWTVTLAPSPAGVRLLATRGSAGEPGMELLLPGVHGVNVRLLDRTASAEWADRWDVLGRVPAAVEVTLYDGRGEPAGPPLQVHAALEAVP